MIVVATPPTVEPDTLVEVKAQARIDHSEDDAQLTSYIKAACETVERRCGIALMTQTLRLLANSFDGTGLRLPRPPLQSVTSIIYKDHRGYTVTMPPSDYSVRGTGGAAIVLPATTWPATDGFFGAVEVTFIAGYGNAPEDVPEPLRVAVMQIVAHLIRNAEGADAEQMHVVPYGFDDLVAEYRQWGFG